MLTAGKWRAETRPQFFLVFPEMSANLQTCVTAEHNAVLAVKRYVKGRLVFLETSEIKIQMLWVFSTTVK
jgi:hypothetical protein